MRKLILVCFVLAVAACGDDATFYNLTDAGIDAGSDQAQVDASCFETPQTHAELLNACVDWQYVDKTPVTPLLNPDGTLPELPQ